MLTRLCPQSPPQPLHAPTHNHPPPTLCPAASLQGYAVKPGGVHVQPAIDSRHNKLALVEFENAAEAVRAMVSVRGREGGEGVLRLG